MKSSNILGLAVFTCLLVLTQCISYQRYLIRNSGEEQHVSNQLQSVKERLTSTISSCTSSLKTFALIASGHSVPEQFDSGAQSILQSYEYIDALQLARNGVVNYTYPRGANDAATGFDALSDSATRTKLSRAIETRKMFFTRPTELDQAGRCVAGIVPVFKVDEFQGFAIVFIRLSTLMKSVGIDTTPNAEFNYQLSLVDPTAHQEEFLLSQSFDADEQHYASIDVPGLGWKIMLEPKNQHGLFLDITLSLMGLFFSLMGGGLARHFAQQPENLKQSIGKNLVPLPGPQDQSRTRSGKDKLVEHNEARLTEAQAVANLGSWETDLLTLKVIWSQQTYKIFELDPAAFDPTHESILDFVYPRDRDKVELAFAASFRSDEKCRIEHRITSGRGAIKWVEEQWRVFQNEQGVPYRAVGTCQDITKRKLDELEKAMLMDNTEESFILLDHNLNIVSFNNQFYVLYEKYFGQIVTKGNSILEYAEPARVDNLKLLYASVLAGRTEESELNLILANGTEKIFSLKYKPARDDSNEIIGVFVTTRDITKRKLAERQIQNEKIFSDSLVNSLPGIFYLYDERLLQME